MSGRNLLLSVVLSVGLLGILQAQGTAIPGMVYVSVQVVDPENRSVTGISKEDFLIAEEGMEQVISFFEEDAREYEYRIGYVPKNAVKDGAWRRIRVRVADPRLVQRKLSVRATAGYYAR
jgi:hypothetical protein